MKIITIMLIAVTMSFAVYTIIVFRNDYSGLNREVKNKGALMSKFIVKKEKIFVEQAGVVSDSMGLSINEFESDEAFGPIDDLFTVTEALNE